VRFRAERDQLRSAQSAWDQRLSDLRAEYLKREQSWDRTRERLTADVDMHMRHRMEVEQILNVELGTEVEDGAGEGFVADVALAFQRRRAEAAALQAKLDLPCGSCHPCTNWADETWRRADRTPPTVSEWDESRALRAAYRAHLAGHVVFPLDWEDKVTTTAYEANRFAALNKLLESWRPATVETAPTHGPDDHEWVPCNRCPNPDQPCACAGGVCCEVQRAEIAAGVSRTGTEASDG
jgi:hypothetical protein